VGNIVAARRYFAFYVCVHCSGGILRLRCSSSSATQMSRRHETGVEALLVHATS
jgi:hypothetical protein